MFKALLIGATMLVPVAASAQTTAPTGGAQATTAGSAQTTTPAPSTGTGTTSTGTATTATGTQATGGTQAGASAGGVTLATKDDVKAGATVLDQKGGQVGTVESVTDTAAVVSTGTVRVSVPIASFGKSDKGLVIAMTKSELEAAAKKAG